MHTMQLVLAAVAPLLVVGAPVDVQSNSLEMADVVPPAKGADSTAVRKRGSFWDWWNRGEGNEGHTPALGPCGRIEQALGRDCDDPVHKKVKRGTPTDVQSNSHEMADSNTVQKRGSFWDWWNEGEGNEGHTPTLGPCGRIEQVLGRDCEDPIHKRDNGVIRPPMSLPPHNIYDHRGGDPKESKEDRELRESMGLPPVAEFMEEVAKDEKKVPDLDEVLKEHGLDLDERSAIIDPNEILADIVAVLDRDDVSGTKRDAQAALHRTPLSKRGKFWDWWNRADIRDGLPSTLGPCEKFEQDMGRDCSNYEYSYDRPADPVGEPWHELLHGDDNDKREESIVADDQGLTKRGSFWDWWNRGEANHEEGAANPTLGPCGDLEIYLFGRDCDDDDD